MKRTTKKAFLATLIATIALTGGCSDLSRSTAPVRLVVTQTQDILRFDIAPNAANCDVSFGTVNVSAVLLTNPNNPNLPVDDRFNDVRLTGYRISYSRRDGGTLVPAPFTRATSGTITAGGAATPLSDIVVLNTSALTQAPFAALTPSGGGKDPQTGKNEVILDTTIEVFGETLAGERVSGSSTTTMKFCYSCGGCA
jgi:hypothetical protein